MLVWGLLVSHMSPQDLSNEIFFQVSGWCVKSSNDVKQYMGYFEIDEH